MKGARYQVRWPVSQELACGNKRLILIIIMYARSLTRTGRASWSRNQTRRQGGINLRVTPWSLRFVAPSKDAVHCAQRARKKLLEAHSQHQSQKNTPCDRCYSRHAHGCLSTKISQASFRARFGTSSPCLSGSRVNGHVEELRKCASIQLRSKLWPCGVTTGSKKISMEMRQHK